ncbi:hypothetical protein RFI_18184 [Reticulomyxa filosa]|uniref:Uncharacterized protein n=1 Tax=Reticulomyxa filosa TaxID=46433 RepID=X6MZH6_RETFI|nr:hypothetical protein RFI_18184 [Reticulomyxa filosa]|eukprot:ETO19058.1 hypothetical protein RFI_18184 [Reticulomyxa filosa]
MCYWNKNAIYTYIYMYMCVYVYENKTKRRLSKKNVGIRPYIQICKNGKSIWSSRQKKKPLQFLSEIGEINQICTGSASRRRYCDSIDTFVFRQQNENLCLQIRFVFIVYLYLFIYLFFCLFVRCLLHTNAFAGRRPFTQDIWKMTGLSLSLQTNKQKSKRINKYNLSHRIPPDFIIDMVVSSEKQSDSLQPQSQSQSFDQFWDEMQKRSLVPAFGALPFKKQNAGKDKTRKKSQTSTATASALATDTVATTHDQSQSLPTTKQRSKSKTHTKNANKTTSKPTPSAVLTENQNLQSMPSKEELTELFEPVESEYSSKNNVMDELEKYAHGLDLDNIEVDSDTEQYFETLTQQISAQDNAVLLFIFFFNVFLVVHILLWQFFFFLSTPIHIHSKRFRPRRQPRPTIVTQMQLKNQTVFLEMMVMKISWEVFQSFHEFFCTVV